MARGPVLTVACVLRQSPEFDVEYVEKLHRGVTQHLKAPHRFVCLSDVLVPCERIPLKTDWPGWWAKIELFTLPGPLLYFDLDTVITGDLSDIAKHAQAAEFTMLRDFYREKGFGSGMIAWRGDMSALHAEFAKRPDTIMSEVGKRGDQGFIEQFTDMRAGCWQDALPGQVVSYKVHVRPASRRGESGTGQIPENARVVCFHGQPKPREVPELWR